MFRTSWIFVALALTACNGDTTKTDKPQATAQTAAQAPATVASSAPVAPPVVNKVELEIASVADTMTFDKSELTVPAKSEVHLVFTNRAKLEALPHNWVLVHEKTEPRVAADGLALGKEKNYLPETDDVIAGTPLAPPGKTSEITFTAPKYPGKYPYICTIPGHYIMMKGVLVVTAAK